MTDNNEGLKRLSLVYDQLDDSEKEKLIRLGEGLLNSQKIIHGEKTKSKEKTESKKQN